MDMIQASKIATFLAALQDCYRDEEDREIQFITKLELSDESLTDDFYAMVQAMFTLYRQITGDEDTDLLGFTHIVNRIVVQNITGTKESED